MTPPCIVDVHLQGIPQRAIRIVVTPGSLLPDEDVIGCVRRHIQQHVGATFVGSWRPSFFEIRARG